MEKSLKTILDTLLEIQEFDMQMIQLMRLKKDRQKELDNLNAIKRDLANQVSIKEAEIMELKKNIRLAEGEVNEVVSRIKKLETQQNSVKKVEEFNVLTQEMARASREKDVKGSRVVDIQERAMAEEEILKNIKESFVSTKESSKILEVEINENISRINAEGRALKNQRDDLVQRADPEVFRIYERLLRNKKDLVIVPIANRCCSGCHIMLTAQDENLVRKGEHLVFCEHCSRIHYWPESQVTEGEAMMVKPRRRRATKV